MDITVAICTYNGESRLPLVLDRLQACRHQTPDRITWEVLVIDNRSRDGTPQVCDRYQDVLPLRRIREDIPGLAFARQRAINAAQGELIGFLDDDNLPEPDWIVAAVDFARDRPQAGAYGSRVLPDYACEPPPNFNRIAPFLAITDRGDTPRIYPPEKRLLPPGAGLVVRRQAWLDSVPTQLALVGRTTQAAIAGEDLEALLYLQQNGWDIWYAPSLRVLHRIPPWRLQPDYLLKLMQGIGLSRYQTRRLSVIPILRPLAIVAYSLNDLRKILRHLWRYRGDRDLVAQCELQLYRASLRSPWYFWRDRLQKVLLDRAGDREK